MLTLPHKVTQRTLRLPRDKSRISGFATVISMVHGADEPITRNLLFLIFILLDYSRIYNTTHIHIQGISN